MHTHCFIQSNRFTATLDYDSSTHHPSQRMRAEVKLNEDFKFFVHVTNKDNVSFLCNMVDIRSCSVTLEPAEVAQNRKRRWSKKFPIVVRTVDEKRAPRKLTVYLFSPTARDKEDWFRRLKSAAEGKTSLQLMEERREFFGYMEKYFPVELLRSLSLRPRPAHPPSRRHQSSSGSGGSSHQHQRLENTLVQFSKSSVESNDDGLSEELEVGGVNITPRQVAGVGRNNSVQSSIDSASHHRLPPVDELGFEHVQSPPPSSSSSVTTASPSSSLRTRGCPAPGHAPTDHAPNQWLNSIAARLCWDVWHQQRWKDWVMTRIQKKLIRAKTPSFMESLRLTDIDIGQDMPMLNRLIGGPRLDLRGIWIYLDVTYRGKFVMTIETKLKLGGSGSVSGGQGEEGGEEGVGQQMSSITKSREESR